jgi:putative DNA primase/helicase
MSIPPDWLEDALEGIDEIIPDTVPAPQRGNGQDREAASVAVAENVLDPSDPMRTARRFLEASFTRDGLSTLHYYLGQFHTWTGAAYPAAEDAAIDAALYHFLGAAQCRSKGGGFEPYKPNQARVSNVLAALRAVAHLPGAIVPPVWLDGQAPAPAGELLACRDRLVHLPTGETFPHSPNFFTPNALPVDYLPEAGESAEMSRFLDDLLDDDAESRDALQEIFGYCLTPDTRQQKIFLIVGPKRSGKGTIARVLSGLLGQHNVAGPTLASLGTNFGLSALLGKQLAVISDARLGGRADQHAIAERLLSISGEDALDIDRKFLAPVTTRLSVRFLILTNELPRIADASGALASRFVVVMLTESFYGREDHDLTGRLLKELPGILNWSIAGWRRLRARGRFVQPAAAAEAVRDLEDLGSPVAAFIRERCEAGPGHQVECQRLYEAWRKWCEEHGRDRAGTAHTFGRDLRAVLPGIRTSNHREDNGRRRVYGGLRLRADWEVDRDGTRTTGLY